MNSQPFVRKLGGMDKAKKMHFIPLDFQAILVIWAGFILWTSKEYWRKDGRAGSHHSHTKLSAYRANGYL